MVEVLTSKQKCLLTFFLQMQAAIGVLTEKGVRTSYGLGPMGYFIKERTVLTAVEL